MSGINPVASLLAMTKQHRLAGDLDAAELELNQVAAYFRAIGEPNTSRAYRAESRAVFFARWVSNQLETPAAPELPQPEDPDELPGVF